MASAFREGRITWLQAEVLLRGVVFWAPPDVAELFGALASRLGLEAG